MEVLSYRHTSRTFDDMEKMVCFFAVSFVTAMLSDCIMSKRKWHGTFITILTVAILLVLCFKDFLFYKLLKDYGSLYEGYKFSLETDFKLITRYFGIIYIAVIAVCSIVIGVNKKESRPLFMWIQLLVCFVMFIMTQTHGQQHLLLYIPSFIMLTLILIKYITKEWMLISISLLAILHSVNVYIPRQQPNNIQEIKRLALIPNFSMLPVTRSDTEQILELKINLIILYMKVIHLVYYRLPLF